MIVGTQIRAGRALVGWYARDLAERSGVSWHTVQRAEAAGDETPGITARKLEAIQSTLEAAGVDFTSDGGPGVRLRR